MSTFVIDANVKESIQNEIIRINDQLNKTNNNDRISFEWFDQISRLKIIFKKKIHKSFIQSLNKIKYINPHLYKINFDKNKKQHELLLIVTDEKYSFWYKLRNSQISFYVFIRLILYIILLIILCYFFMTLYL